MSDLAIWLIYSREHNAWWRPNSAGYTEFIGTAGRYTKTDANGRCNGRDYDPAKGVGPPEVACIAPEAEEVIADLLSALKATTTNGHYNECLAGQGGFADCSPVCQQVCAAIRRATEGS